MVPSEKHPTVLYGRASEDAAGSLPRLGTNACAEEAMDNLSVISSNQPPVRTVVRAAGPRTTLAALVNGSLPTCIIQEVVLTMPTEPLPTILFAPCHNSTSALETTIS